MHDAVEQAAQGSAGMLLDTTMGTGQGRFLGREDDWRLMH